MMQMQVKHARFYLLRAMCYVLRARISKSGRVSPTMWKSHKLHHATWRKDGGDGGDGEMGSCARMLEPWHSSSPDDSGTRNPSVSHRSTCGVLLSPPNEEGGKQRHPSALPSRNDVVLGFRQPCAKARPCFHQLLCDVLRVGCAPNQIKSSGV